MTENEYITELTKAWPSRSSREPTPATIQLSLDAVEAFPLSAKLWLIRGDLLQLIDFECNIPLNASEYCYKKAIAADRFSSEAYEELGYFLKTVMSNPRKAKRFFDKARRLKKAQKS